MTPIQTPHRGIRSRHDTSVFEKYALSNGAVVWVQKSPVLLTEEGMLVAYFRNVGSVLDPKGKEGLAHFLEHMPFKGTKKYPSSEALSAAIQDIGGGKNATTSRYWTNYYAGAPGSAFSVALDILADTLTAPLMRPEDFETERGVIESERARKFEHGAALAARDVDDLLFGDHPALTWGIGTKESIQAITLDDILSFWKEHYHAGNLHLVVGGTFAEEPDLLAKLEAAFGGLEAGPAVRLDLPPMPVPPAGRHRLVNPRYSRSRFYLEWIVDGPVSDASMEALGLLTSSFCDASDSPLAMELRDRRGLVYESGLMDEERIGDIGCRITLELPVSADIIDEVAETSLRLLREMPEERIALQLDRWQLARLMGFHYPTRVCTNLGGEIVRFGGPRSIHEDQQLSDDTDLELVLQWQKLLTTTPPVIIETSSGK